MQPLIRPLDLLGVEDEDHLLLVAVNTDDRGAGIIHDRLEKAGLTCEITG